MELEEMKREWERMSERLQRTELLNRKLVRGMLVRQGKSAQDRLLARMSNWTIAMIAGEAVLLALLVALCMHGTAARSSGFVFALSAAAMLSGAYAIRFTTVCGKALRRIDFSGSVVSQLEIVGRLLTSWGRFMRTGWIFFILIVVLSLLEGILRHDPGRIVWTLLAVPVCLLLARWDDNRFREDTRSVRESLEKLRDVENEEC